MPFTRATGEVHEAPSYLWAWLSSVTNQGIALGCAACGVVLSFPMGMVGAAMAAMGFIAIEGLTAIYVPTSGVFRAGVDRADKARRRAKVAANLSSEIHRRSEDDKSDDGNWSVYGHMQTRIQFLHEMALNRDVPLTEADMDRMEDACLDYLGLWLASMSMDDRARTVDEDNIHARLEALDAQPRGNLSRGDLAQMDKARVDLEEILRRRARLGARKAAVDAKLLSIPDTLEEIYHTVITAPTSGSQTDRLQDAINRLQVEEDLEAALNTELGDSPVARRTAAPTSNAAPARAAQRQ